MKLTPDQLSELANFLRAVSRATRETGVTVTPNGPTYLGIGDGTIAFSWDTELGHYVIDDRIGD